MKLGIIAGWMAAGILGASIILGQGTASAEFVTVDEFEEDYNPPGEVGGTREPIGVTFESGRAIIGNSGASLFYEGISLPELTLLRLSDVVNTGDAGVEITAWLDFSDGSESQQDTETAPVGNSDLVFFSEMVDAFRNVVNVEFVFDTPDSSETSSTLSSESFDAEFETASSGGSPQAVPEPTSLVLFGLASAGGGIAAWRKRRKQTVSSAGRNVGQDLS